MANPGYHVAVATPPAALPVTLAEIKAHLRVLHASEDALIERYVRAAVAQAENMTGRSLITRGLTVACDALPYGRRPLVLLRPPVTAVNSLRYLDADGIEQTMAGATLTLVPSLTTAEIVPASGNWPASTPAPRSVVISYTAGYGAAGSDVPEDLRAAIFLLAEHHYYHRSAVADTSMSVVPLGVEALLSPYRTAGWL